MSKNIIMKNFVLKYLKKTVRTLDVNTGLFKTINFTMIKYFNGKRVKIPVIRGIGLYNLSLSELWMFDILKVLLKNKTGIFIDVGTNIGQSLIKLRCIDSLTEYIGFEPNPVCIFYLKELIKQNKFKNCRIFPVGLFDKKGLLELQFTNDSIIDSSATFIKDFRPNSPVHSIENVPVITFKDVEDIISLKNLSVIKIDVEGSELEVVRSLYKTIYRFRPYIILEILPIYSNENKMRLNRQDEIENIFKELHYSIFRVLKNENNGFVGLSKLKNIEVHSDLNQCDYILVPNELVNMISIKSIMIENDSLLM